MVLLWCLPPPHNQSVNLTLHTPPFFVHYASLHSCTKAAPYASQATLALSGSTHMDITSFVENNYKLFGSFDKPVLATDIHHCEECRDHNDEVGGTDRRRLTPEQIGTACWGISSFLTPQAMGYYIPRFMELAVTAENDKDGVPYMCLYINQIGLHSDSEQFSLFSIEQRLAVHNSLVILKDLHLQTLTEHCWEDEIDTAINQWST